MKAKLLAIWTSVKADLADTWVRTKIWLLGILAIVVAIEFEKIKQFLLVYMGKKEIQKDQKIDAKLSAQESSENTQANLLIQEAEGLPSKEKPVTDGWEKKE